MTCQACSDTEYGRSGTLPLALSPERSPRYTAVAMYVYDPAAMARHHGAKHEALDAAMYFRSVDTDGVAEAVGVDVQTVRRWLRCESVPTGAHLVALLTLLDAPRELLAEPPLRRGEALALMVAHDAVRRKLRQP